MFLDIFKDIERFMKPFNDFITNNSNNPLFWIVIIGIFFGIFAVAYYYLHRGE